MADEEKYHRVLEELSKITQESQAYRARTETTLGEMSDRLNTYWKATAAGMRQLADWFAKTEDEAREERHQERSKRSRQEWLIIALLVVAIVLELLLRWR